MKLNYEDLDKENIELANTLHSGSKLINPKIPELDLENAKKESKIRNFFEAYRLPAVVSLSMLLIVVIGVGVTNRLSGRMENMFTSAGSALDSSARPERVCGSSAEGDIAEDGNKAEIKRVADRSEALLRLSFLDEEAPEYYVESEEGVEFGGGIDQFTEDVQDGMNSKKEKNASSIIVDSSKGGSSEDNLNYEICGDNTVKIKMRDKEHIISGQRVEDYIEGEDCIYVIACSDYTQNETEDLIPKIDGEEIAPDKLIIPEGAFADSYTVIACFSSDDKFELLDCVAFYGKNSIMKCDEGIFIATEFLNINEDNDPVASGKEAVKRYLDNLDETYEVYDNREFETTKKEQKFFEYLGYDSNEIKKRVSGYVYNNVYMTNVSGLFWENGKFILKGYTRLQGKCVGLSEIKEESCISVTMDENNKTMLVNKAEYYYKGDFLTGQMVANYELPDMLEAIPKKDTDIHIDYDLNIIK